MKPNFKVIEIMDANTIRVIPAWRVQEPWDESATSGNIVRLSCFDKISPADKFAENRLALLILDKKINLMNPEILVGDQLNNNIVICNVMLEETDVSYYFPGYATEVVN